MDCNLFKQYIKLEKSFNLSIADSSLKIFCRIRRYSPIFSAHSEETKKFEREKPEQLFGLKSIYQTIKF